MPTLAGHIRFIAIRTLLTLALISVFAIFWGALAQTPEVENAEARFNRVLTDSGRAFRDGMSAVKEKRPSDAAVNFNRSVEVFLVSTLNTQKEPRLQACYNQLIETVYRIEFPSDVQPPQIRSLAATCGWNWSADDLKAADEVAAILRQPPAKASDADKAIIASAAGSNGVAEVPVVPVSEDNIDATARAVAAAQAAAKATEDFLNKQVDEWSKLKIVKAQAGDTVQKLAVRHRADTVEVAKLNGLLPTSVLGAGREIKLPRPIEGKKAGHVGNTESIGRRRMDLAKPLRYEDTVVRRGPKPTMTKDGRIKAITAYFNEFLHDPYSMRIVRQWPAEPSLDSWRVRVKYRAKNTYGAYILTEKIFYIKNNKVISTFEL